MGKLFEELKRRKVFRVAAVYAVVAWVLIQVSDVVLPTFEAPAWVNQTIIFLFILGFIPTLIAAWAYEVTPDGVKPDTGFSSTQIAPSNSTDRKLIYLILGLVLLVAGFQIADRLTTTAPSGTTTPVSLANYQADTQRVSLVLPADEPMVFGGTDGHSLTISPDGKTVAYVAANLDGVLSDIKIRRLDAIETQTLPGTERPRQPFFSPDGQWLGFFTGDGVLKKVALSGGQAVTVLDGINGARWSFGTWLDNNQIVFDDNRTLKSVSADGGEASTLLIEPNESRGELGHAFPTSIPGTDVVLFETATRIENQFSTKIEALKTSTGERQVILENARFPKYIESGHLLFRQNEVNLVAPFDPVLLELTGPAVALTDEMRRDGSNSNGDVSQLAVSRSGTLAYAPLVPSLREPYVVNRDGSREPLGISPELYDRVSVSPDGQYVALSIGDGFESEIRLYDFSRETTTRLSQDNDSHPFWHPDSQALVVGSDAGPQGLWLKQLDGNQRLLVEFEGGFVLRNGSWHPDGRRLAVTRQSGSEHDILLLTVDEEITIEPLLVGSSRDHSPRFSPDGNWLAYVSDKSGQPLLYIRQFPDGEDIIVSNEQRSFGPLWSADGTELFFERVKEGENSIDAVMAVVSITEIENRIQISQPVDLFPMYSPSETGVMNSYSQSSNGGQRYGLLPDGRFLMLYGPSGSLQNEIVLVQNWFEELEQLAPHNLQ